MISYLNIEKGWIVEDTLGNQFEVLDGPKKLVHEVKLIKGENCASSKYAFNWRKARKKDNAGAWHNVVKPKHIIAYYG